jgi:hypothetical protein
VLYISEHLNKIISNPIKKVSVRVEVDKYYYSPDIITDFDLVKYLESTLNTAIAVGKSTATMTRSDTVKETASSVLISPFKNSRVSNLIITSPYGVRIHPITKIKKMHDGVDLIVQNDDWTLQAPADGNVIYAGWVSGYGNFIQIKHANDFSTCYGHLKSLNVVVGNAVHQGEVIGVAGNTGNSTGTHLHYEVRKYTNEPLSGQSVDPSPYLTGDSLVQNITKVTYGSSNPNNKFSVPNTVDKVEGEKTLGTGVRAYTLYETNLNKEPKADSDFYRNNSSPISIPSGIEVYITKKYGEWCWCTLSYLSVTRWGWIESSYLDHNYKDTNRDPLLTRRKNIIKAAMTYGLPVSVHCVAFLMAMCEQETQFGTTGKGRVSEGSFILGYGLSFDENNNPVWNYKFSGICAQMRAGAVRFRESMASRDFMITSFNDVHFYQKGGDLGPNYQWTHEEVWRNNIWLFFNSDPGVRDKFMNKHPDYYVTASDINTEKAETDTAVVTKSTIPVYNNKDRDSQLDTLNDGETVDILEKYGDGWSRVRTSNNIEGYVTDDYLDITNQIKLTENHEIAQVFYEDFTSYAPDQFPTTPLFNNPDKWTIVKDGSKNVLKYSPGTNGYIKIDIKGIAGFGVVDVEYKALIAGDNNENKGKQLKMEMLNSTKGTQVTFLEIDENTEGYTHVSTEISEGTNTIIMSVSGTSSEVINVAINAIDVKQYVKKPEDKTSIYDNEANRYEVPEILRVSVGNCSVYYNSNGTNKAGDVFRGDSYKILETINEYYKIDYKGTNAYILKRFCEVYKKQIAIKSLRTGGFVYGETIVLDNVISVDMDYKYNMSVSEASITLSNENGEYSPTYNNSVFGGPKSKLVDYINGHPVSVLSDNTPVRIYIGYEGNLVRRFTGFIDNVTESGDSNTMSIKCSDMMKLPKNYTLYKDLKYPDNDTSTTVWLASAILQDLAVKAGLSSWRVVKDDIDKDDIVIEDSYVTDLTTSSGTVIKIVNGVPTELSIAGTPNDKGYSNPYVIPTTKTFNKGSNIFDNMQEICTALGYWQRCDIYGTYRADPIQYDFSGKQAVLTITDEDLIKIDKAINTDNIRNHIIVTDGTNSSSDNLHFFDKDLWVDAKGERRTMQVYFPWATSYGMKKSIADKYFYDMALNSRTLQIAIEGNPYLELLDVLKVKNKSVQVFSDYVIKGIKESWSKDTGYVSYLDLFWKGYK